MHNTASLLASQHHLAASISGHNPDVLNVSSGFLDASQEQQCKNMVYMFTRDHQGKFSAEAMTRLAQQPAGGVDDREEFCASSLLRAVGTVHRPSGKMAGAVLAHLALKAERTATPEGNYIVLRVGSPSVHAADFGTKVEALEATLQNLMEQTIAMSTLLCQSLNPSADDCVMWNFPLAARETPFMQELNSRLVALFHGTDKLSSPSLH